jgi:anti-sigma B factor antagonist
MRDRLANIEFDDVSTEVVIAAVSGEVDGSNAAELRRAVAERVPSSARTLILDLTDTAYIDSAGVELLFELARRLSARRQELRVVVPVGSGVRRVLELCDINSVATLAGIRDEALGAEPA